MPESFRTYRLPLAPQPAVPAASAIDLLPSRRGFLRGLAASMALAGMYGCSKRPQETIVPYVNQPEQMVPGEPLFFATTLTRGGYGRGVIVTSREGRPIKIEGNPDHPASLGAADVFMQAAVLDLYDPARSKTVTRGGEPATWGDFVRHLREQLLLPAAGSGLRILTGNVGSPTELRLIDRVLKKYPGATWHAYELIDRSNTHGGATLAFGRPGEPVFQIQNAAVVVAVDSDFLTDDPASLAYARGFSTSRQAQSPSSSMGRLYAVESTFSITGSKADHRLPLRPAEIGEFVFALAAAMGVGPPTPFANQHFVDAVAADLKAHASNAIIVGERQPPAVHAAAHRIHQAMNSFGNTLNMVEPVAKGVGSGAQSLADLTADLAAGKVSTVLILGDNPARTAPADVPFATELGKLSAAIDSNGKPKNCVAHLGLYADETTFSCQWHIPETHALETWGDARAHDGTASIVQPLIAPLFDGRPAIDILNVLLGKESTTAYETVRDSWRTHFQHDFEKEWTDALQRGILRGTSAAFEPRDSADPLAPVSTKAHAMPGVGLMPLISEATTSTSVDTLDVLFVPDLSIHDGRFFHNAWLQELPRPLTKIVWGNAALISPATAGHFALVDGDVVKLAAGGRSIEIPILALPGHANGVATLHLGYGRHALFTQPTSTSGGPGNEVFGVDVYPLRTSTNAHTLTGVTLTKTGRTEIIVRTHNHHAMSTQKGDDRTINGLLTPVVIATPATSEEDLKLHNRKIIRTATRDQFAAKPDFAQAMEEKKTLSLYTPWDYSSSPQWGMTIDLSTCIGCNACTIACQAENNIPVVGPEGVEREREMHWIRIDSYFDDNAHSPAVYHQPVPCMHCENAPCEYVCPVAATSHSTDGLNQMTYNRCVGTRYCSNNCPYKVRRFNFFNYTIDTPATVALQHNPDVTVRTLGVMEKCTYCVQRIEYTKRKSEIASLDVRLKQGDDAAKKTENVLINRLQTACQQTCPTQAITFGNIADSTSVISAAKKNPRNYGLLTELTTKPRTTYLAHISNPSDMLPGTSVSPVSLVPENTGETPMPRADTGGSA